MMDRLLSLCGAAGRWASQSCAAALLLWAVALASAQVESPPAAVPVPVMPEASGVSGGSGVTTTPRGAWTADLPVVSDGTHLWTAVQGVKDIAGKSDQPIVRLYHAQAADAPPRWEAVAELRGRINTAAFVAQPSQLTMAFEDGTVQTATLRPAPIEGKWYLNLHASESVPAGHSVRAMAADSDSVWALVRIETAEAFAQFSRLAADPEAEASADSSGLDPELLNLVLKLPRELEVEPAAAPAGATDAEAAGSASTVEDAKEVAAVTVPADAGDDVNASAEESATSTTSLPREGLLRWGHNGQVQRIVLPEDWNAGLSAQMAATPQGVVITTQRRDNVNVWRWSQDRWSQVALASQERGAIVPITLGSQVLLSQYTPSKDGFAVRVEALRGDERVEVGRLSLSENEGLPAGGRWTVLPWGEDQVALAVGERGMADSVADLLRIGEATDATPGPTLTAIDLHGQSTLPPVTLGVNPQSEMQRQADTILLMGVVIASTILLFTFWKRDPLANVLKLPKGWTLADLSRRMFAGMLDVAPGVAVALWWWDLEPVDLHMRWPGRGMGATWDLMLPGIVAIGITVAHTALLEAIAGRSLGKFATGLRVVTLAGEKPAPWRILARCLLKAFDLVAYLLLVLMIVSPYKQRLGDMVAGTVVVARALGQVREDTDNDKEKNQRGDKDDDETP